MAKPRQIAPGATPAEQIAELRRWIETHRDLLAEMEDDREFAVWPTAYDGEIALLRAEIAEWHAEIKRLEQSPPPAPARGVT